MNLHFEWDVEKEKINIAKHGIDFEIASHVFLDPIAGNITMKSIVW